MNYYFVEESLDEKIVGKDFPQAYKFIKGYNPDAPKALFSLYNFRESFPNYIPELDGIMLAGSAKLTDFVSNGFSSRLIIVSERVKEILEKFHLCPHQFYPLGLYKRKVKYNYYLLQIVPNYIDYVDFLKTTFIKHNMMNRKIFSDISINSKDELFRKVEEIEEREGMNQTVSPNRIVMSDLFDKELDLFSITRIDAKLYISERLKNAIEAEGLTGWDFMPATNLVVE